MSSPGETQGTLREVPIRGANGRHPVRVILFRNNRPVSICTTRARSFYGSMRPGDKLAALCRDRAPAWSEDGEDLVLGDVAEIDLHVWSFCRSEGNADHDVKVRERVVEGVLAANAIFEAQGLGIRLRTRWRTPATRDVRVSPQFRGGRSEIRALRRATGKKDDELGLVVVDCVSATIHGRGVVLGSTFGTIAPVEIPGADFIVLGREFGHHLLAHEVGHILGLKHPIGAYVTSRNIMRQVSGWRECLNERQCLAANRSPWVSRTTSRPADMGETQGLGLERFIEQTFERCELPKKIKERSKLPDFRPCDCGVHQIDLPPKSHARRVLTDLERGKRRAIYRVYGVSAVQHAARRRFRSRQAQLREGIADGLGLDADHPVLGAVYRKPCAVYVEEAVATYVMNNAYLADHALERSSDLPALFREAGLCGE